MTVAEPSPELTDSHPIAMTAAGFAATAGELEEQLHRHIVGQPEVVRQTLVALLAGGHVLLEGVPGLGKTALVRAIGQALDLGFARVQFTPDLMPADILGTTVIQDIDGRRDFAFHPGPIFTNLLLADEVNRATPKTQSALLEAMQERTVTTGGASRPLPSPFFVLATQNPIELEGTYPLPEAQLDRFLFKVLVPFPDHGDLTEIVRRTTGAPPPVLTSVANGSRLLDMQALARRVPIADHVIDYAVRLVSATHPDRSPLPEVRDNVRYGASPRGIQAMVLGAKATALLAGRFNVAFDDIREMARPALRHRLILGYEADAAGVDADALVGRLLETVTTDPAVD